MTQERLTATSLDTIPADQGDLVRRLGNAAISAEARARNAIAMLHLGRGEAVMPVDNYTHCLQTATRAHLAGEDESAVVLALLHDIADNVQFSADHGAIACLVFGAWLTDQQRWTLVHHGEFQNYFRAFRPEPVRSQANRWLGHPHHAATLEFCKRYDQNSFDPEYRCLPLDFFEPMVHRFFARTPLIEPGSWSIATILAP